MYDVAIIGAGVIGASIFRELTKYDLKVTVLEKENDVSMGTSKANSAIVHAGYDPKVGTLMAKYNVKGNEMFEDLCKELSVPFKRNGSLIIAFSEEDMETVKNLYENGNKIGVKGLQILSKEEVLEKEPNLSHDIVGALYAPTGGIVGPYEYTIALMENAVSNGGELKLRSEVKNIEKENDIFKITTTDGKVIEAKYVINAAGVHADEIHNLIAKESFKIIPRKGEYFVMDKTQGKLVSSTIFQCPSKLGKGILVTPTVHGNLLVGPDAQDIEDKEDKSTAAEIVFMELSPEEKAEVIKKDPRYGKIICRCESITEGEIVNAIHRSFGSITLDGVKRRCRPGMGRCQGGFCGPKVQEIIARELKIPMEDIYQEKDGSYILVGKTK